MVTEPEVHCWRVVHEVRINAKLPASAVPIKFEYRQSIFVGPLGECRIWAHEQSIALGIPFFEVENENPNLSNKVFEPLGVYLVAATDFPLIRGDEPNEFLAAQPLAGGHA